MSIVFLLIAVPLVAFIALGLDRIAGRRIGWLLPIAAAGYVGWPRGNSEQNVYGYVIAGVVAVVLLIAYGATSMLVERRKAE